MKKRTTINVIITLILSLAMVMSSMVVTFAGEPEFETVSDVELEEDVTGAVTSVVIMAFGNPVTSGTFNLDISTSLYASVTGDSTDNSKVIWNVEQDSDIIALYSDWGCTEPLTTDPTDAGLNNTSIYFKTLNQGTAKIILTSAEDTSVHAEYVVTVQLEDYYVRMTADNGKHVNVWAAEQLPTVIGSSTIGWSDFDDAIRELYDIKDGYFTTAALENNGNVPTFDDTSVTKGNGNIHGAVEYDEINIYLDDVFEGSYKVNNFYYYEKDGENIKLANNGEPLNISISLMVPTTNDDQPGSDNPGGDNPGGSDQPGGDQPGGEDVNPGGDNPGGEDVNPGGSDQPGGEDIIPGGDVTPDPSGKDDETTISTDKTGIKHEYIKVADYTLDIAYPEKITYVGKKSIPEVTINDLKSGSEVTISGNKTGIVFSKLKFKNNTKVKKGKFAISLKAANGASKELKKAIKAANKELKAKSLEYTLAPRDLSKAKVSGSAAYSSKSNKWKFKLTVDVPNGKPMKLKYSTKAGKSDFTVDSKYDGSAATVKITGTGLYTGEVEVPVTIK